VAEFVVLSAIWGGSFALIKVAVDGGVAPLWVALWRCLFGALTLWILCLATRTAPSGDRRVWGHAVVVALLFNAVPFALFAYGETHISSVLAGVWNATTPLATLVFVLALVRAERPTVRRLLGLATGLVGVLVVLGVWRSLPSGLLSGTVACLAATMCYGAGFAYTRRFFSGRSESAAVLSAVQVTCATLELALVTPLAAGVPGWPGVGAAASLVVLGALGTGLAYVLNVRIIRAAGSTVASTVTYVVPLWSTLFGAVLLGEPLTWNTAAGAVLVVAGVVLSRNPASRRSDRPAAMSGNSLDQPADHDEARRR